MFSEQRGSPTTHMMLRNETWMVALEALWANKIRAFLTTLGVIIGSACIVLVVTVALSGRRYVIAQIEGVGSNLVYARLDIDPNRPAMLQDELSLEDMNAAKTAIPGVVTVAGTRGMASSVIAGSVEHNVSLVGVTEGFQQIRNLLILRGRFLDTEDVDARSRVCLITTQLADLMFPPERSDRTQPARRRTQFYGHRRVQGARGNFRAIRDPGLHRSDSLPADEILSGRYVPGNAVRAGQHTGGRDPHDASSGSAAGEAGIPRGRNIRCRTSARFWKRREESRWR